MTQSIEYATTPTSELSLLWAPRQQAATSMSAQPVMASVCRSAHGPCGAICDLKVCTVGSAELASPNMSTMGFVDPPLHGSVQANTGAKNHAVLLPDAHPEAAAAALIGASMGAAGQRCMAISAAVFVGGLGAWADRLKQRAENLNMGPGYHKSVDVGPVISPEAKARVLRLIDSAEQQVTLPLCLPALAQLTPASPQHQSNPVGRHAGPCAEPLLHSQCSEADGRCLPVIHVLLAVVLRHSQLLDAVKKP